MKFIATTSTSTVLKSPHIFLAEFNLTNNYDNKKSNCSLNQTHKPFKSDIKKHLEGMLTDSRCSGSGKHLMIRD